MSPEVEVIGLHETETRELALSVVEAAELQGLRLSVEVVAGRASDDAVGRQLYRIHGNHHVGYFRLKSGRLVRIEPKVPLTNVFSLLAAAYRYYENRSPFLAAVVPYADVDAKPLQALVEHFTAKVETLLREGILRRYIEQEENLSTIRGRIKFEQQIRQNLVRGDRLFCRYASYEVDNWENRVVLWTLLLLARTQCWPSWLRQKLQAQIMRFGGVSMVRISRGQTPQFVYDRLSARYQAVHAWCRFFIDQMTLSDRNGIVNFHGFLLNMFELFERFVFCAFQEAAARSSGIHVRKQFFPLDVNDRVGIHPDLYIESRQFVAVGDAKYKVTRDELGRHPDLYQVIAYSLALGLTGMKHRPQALLIYPATERTTELEGELRILTSAQRKSNLTVRTLWLDLSSRDVVRDAVNAAGLAIRQAELIPPVA